MTPTSGRHQAGRNMEVATSRQLKNVRRVPPSSSISLVGLWIIQLVAILMGLSVLIGENCGVFAMSKRFLKGFIMGAMFSHHHKP